MQRLQDLGHLRRIPGTHTPAATVAAARAPGAVPLPRAAAATLPAAAAVKEAAEAVPGQLADAAREAKHSLFAENDH